MTQYEQILKQIHAHGRFSGTAGLHRMQALMEALGNPQVDLKFVHIAGTNGKGSTALMIAAALEQAGLKTGLFISPYVLDFCERIQINREWISQNNLCSYAQRILEAERSLDLPEGESIGEFEFTTALALLYFAEQKCDIVVLEVGLGGRYDATNIIEAPEVAVMTHVALDHMAVLGNTVEEIAADKSYIVKHGTTLVSAPHQSGDVPRVLQQRCNSIDAKYVECADYSEISTDFSGGYAEYKGKKLYTRMVGKHQLDNMVTAYEALIQLSKMGYPIPEAAIDAGFSSAVMPARQQVLSEDPLFIIDGAHNLDGISALCTTLDEMLPPGGISLILGMVDDKQVEQCIRMLVRRADAVYAVEPDTPRAVPSSTISRIVREFSPYTNAFDCKDVRSALRRVKMSDCDVIVVCGSLYVASQVEILVRGDKI